MFGAVNKCSCFYIMNGKKLLKQLDDRCKDYVIMQQYVNPYNVIYRWHSAQHTNGTRANHKSANAPREQRVSRTSSWGSWEGSWVSIKFWNISDSRITRKRYTKQNTVTKCCGISVASSCLGEKSSTIFVCLSLPYKMDFEDEFNGDLDEYTGIQLLPPLGNSNSDDARLPLIMARVAEPSPPKISLFNCESIRNTANWQFKKG